MPPPGETGQEALYLKSLSERKIPVTVKLRDGETVKGWIEYFDDGMLRLTREGKPNLFIYKHQIRTITEAGKRRAAGGRNPRRRAGYAGFAVSAAAESLKWVPAASAIAREAGARLREFLAEGVATEYKGDVDIVTVADRTVEKLIRARLAEAFPGHGIYGEEGTRERLDHEYRWYVDPLDGTTNFAHGLPHFSVSLGLEQRSPGLATNGDGTLEAGDHLRPHAR